MSSAEDLIAIVNQGGAAGARAFDQLVLLGREALPAVIEALAQERAVPRWTSALAALRMQDPALPLEPYLNHASHAVQDAVIRALGRGGDERAVDVLEAILVKRQHVLATVDALGDLGVDRAVAPLRDHARELVGDPFSPERLSALCDEMLDELDPYPLLDLLMTARSLARLGDMSLVPAARALAAFRADDPDLPEAGEIRLAAVNALDVMIGAGVASSLEAACDDANDEVVEAAMFALVHLGRPRFVERLMTLVAGGARRAGVARFCIAQILGEDPFGDDEAPSTIEAAKERWSRMPTRFQPELCYRFGRPATPGLLVEALSGRDPALARIELLQATGLRFLALGMDEPPPSEIVTANAWWAENQPRFPPGRLHRWGRSHDPEAVD